MGGEHPAGGSRLLADLIDRYGEDLIPDLKERYGIDLADLFRDDEPLSPRWVLMHIRHLPTGSAFTAARRGGQQYRDWTPDRYYRVASVNALRAIQHMYLLSHIDSKKHRVPDPPEPVTTPSSVQDRQASSRNHKPGSFTHTVAALKVQAQNNQRRKAANNG